MINPNLEGEVFLEGQFITFTIPLDEKEAI